MAEPPSSTFIPPVRTSSSKVHPLPCPNLKLLHENSTSTIVEPLQVSSSSHDRTSQLHHHFLQTSPSMAAPPPNTPQTRTSHLALQPLPNPKPKSRSCTSSHQVRTPDQPRSFKAEPPFAPPETKATTTTTGALPFPLLVAPFSRPPPLSLAAPSFVRSTPLGKSQYRRPKEKLRSKPRIEISPAEMNEPRLSPKRSPAGPSGSAL